MAMILTSLKAQIKFRDVRGQSFQRLMEDSHLGKDGLDSRGEYKKRNPLIGQAICLGFAALSAGFGIYGVWANDARVLYYRLGSVSSRNYETLHVHGGATWISGAADFMIAAGFLLVIVKLSKKTKAEGKAYERPAFILLLAGLVITYAMGVAKHWGMI